MASNHDIYCKWGPIEITYLWRVNLIKVSWWQMNTISGQEWELYQSSQGASTQMCHYIWKLGQSWSQAIFTMTTSRIRPWKFDYVDWSCVEFDCLLCSQPSTTVTVCLFTIKITSKPLQNNLHWEPFYVSRSNERIGKSERGAFELQNAQRVFLMTKLWHWEAYKISWGLALPSCMYFMLNLDRLQVFQFRVKGLHSVVMWLFTPRCI